MILRFLSDFGVVYLCYARNFFVRMQTLKNGLFCSVKYAHRKKHRSDLLYIALYK